MSLKLNKIENNIVAENVANNRTRLENFLSADSSSPMRSDPVRYARRLSDAAIELGLGLYQQEGSPDEIRRSFDLAGSHLCSILLIDRPNAALSPLEFEKALALASCFSQPAVLADIASVPFGKFFSDAQALAFYAILARSLDLDRNYITSGQFDQAAWQQLETSCLQNNADKYDAVATLAKLRALKAVSTGDAAMFNASIETLVKDHEDQAQHGENQRSSRAFICFPALMFVHLGAARNLVCSVQSPYLPVQLLNR
jgi:hypothetical protein